MLSVVENKIYWRMVLEYTFYVFGIYLYIELFTTFKMEILYFLPHLIELTALSCYFEEKKQYNTHTK